MIKKHIYLFFYVYFYIHSPVYAMNREGEGISLNDLNMPIKDAVYYIFKKKDWIINESRIKIFYVSFYKNTSPYHISDIQLKADEQDPAWTTAHEEYCNALLDPTIKIEDKQITHAEIKIPDPWYKDYGRFISPVLSLYNGETIMGELDFYIPNNTTEENITDLKNPDHFFAKNCRPRALFSNMKYVTYHNGYYPEKIYIYDKQNNSNLKSTWQNHLAKTTAVCLVGTSVFIMICIENMLKNYLKK